MSKFLAFLFFITQGANCLFGQNAWTWTDNAMDNVWDSAENWTPTGGPPGAVITNTDIANFGAVGSGTISLDTPIISPGLNSLTFNNTSGFTLFSPNSSPNYIQFNLDGTTLPTLKVLAGSQTINTRAVINNTTLNIEVSDSSLLTVQQQMVANPSGNINFSGPGQMTVSSPIDLNGDFNQSSGTFVLSNQQPISSGNSAQLSANNIVVSGGSYKIINTGAISGGIGAFTLNGDISGTMTFNNAETIVSNSGTISLSGGEGSLIQSSADLTINQGTLNVENTGAVSTGIGATIIASLSGGTLTMNNVIVSVMNGDSTNPDAGSISALANAGSQIRSLSDFTMSQGTLNIVNYGPVANDLISINGSIISSQSSMAINDTPLTVSNHGSLAPTGNSSGCTLQSTGTMTITGESATFENTGAVAASNNGGSGVFLNPQKDFIANNVTLSFSNSGPLSGTFVSGCSFEAGTSITLTGGAANFENTGTVTSIDNGASAIYVLPLTDFVANNATLIFSNSGVLSGVASVGVNVFPQNNCTINGGTTTLVNTASVSGTYSNGVLLNAFNTLTFNGGTVSVTNTGASLGSPTTFPSSIGPYGGKQMIVENDAKINLLNSGLTQECTNIFSGAGTDFTMSSGTIVAENSGAVTSTMNQAEGIAIGAYTGTFTLNNGSITLINSGDVHAVAKSCGTQINTTNFLMNDGILTLSNSGNITGSSCAGNLIEAIKSAIINGGTLTLSANTGSLSGTNVSGSRMEANGGLHLNGGLLLNNDTVQTPTLTIAVAGNLAGNGLFTDIAAANTTHISNSGTMTPGTPGPASSNPGVMTIGGSYTQSATGTLIANLLNTTSYSQLNILGTTPGTAQLNGSLQVGLSPGSTVAPGDKFTIIKTAEAKGVKGVFSHVTYNTPNLMPQIQYLPNSVIISFMPTLPSENSSVGGSYVGGFSNVFVSSINQLNVHLGRQMVRLRDRFVTRNTYGSNELTQLLVSNDPLADVSDEREFVETDATELVETHEEETFEMASECKPALPWNLYLGPTGNFGKAYKTGSQVGFNYWSSGALMGLDYAFSQFGAGALLDYNHISGDAHKWGHFHIDDAHGSLYATYAPERLPQLGFDAIVGGSYEWYDFHRKIEVLPLVAVGKPHGGEFDALFGIEYAWTKNRIELTPMASIQYIYLKVGSYTEKSAGAYNLHMNNQTIKSLRSTLGARFNYIVTKECYSVSIEIDGAWQREYLNHNRSLAFTPVAFVEPFSGLIIPGSGRNIALAGIDILTTYREKYGWEVSYDFEWNESYLNHNFYLGFNANF